MSLSDGLERIRARKAELLEEMRTLELREAELVGQASVQGTHNEVTTPSRGSQDPAAVSPAASLKPPHPPGFVGSCSLSSAEVQRYSRQMLLPSFGTKAQERLAGSSVLIVGAGGLGSPAALYLAASGIGRLGIVDRDTVELSNLHRQIIHSEGTVGQSKVSSALEACKRLNSRVTVEIHGHGFTPENALSIADRYDVIIDASDNVTTRYLVSDAAVVAQKPLVFGAALGMEGQLSVYNFKGGPCYRCLFPQPPPADACQRCSEAGVLGVVPGVVGTLQAAEAIKIAAGVGSPLSARMLHYDALTARFLVVKLRGQSRDCSACGVAPTITRSSLAHFGYENFTNTPLHDMGPARREIIPPALEISPKELAYLMSSRSPCNLLDVRAQNWHAFASLPGSLNVPLKELELGLPRIQSMLQPLTAEEKPLSGQLPPLVVYCRRGNDSQHAVSFLQAHGFQSARSLRGGLHAWGAEVDESFPIL